MAVAQTLCGWGALGEAKIGLGDNLMATGFARGALARGKRIAFGDGKRLIWDTLSAGIFQRNPNICRPGQEHSSSAEWVHFYRGNRLYNKQGNGRWIWNYDFRPIPGEMFFAREELQFADNMRPGFIVIEPNVPANKSVAPNKHWPTDRYEEVARRLVNDGHVVVQLKHGAPYKLKSASSIHSPNFRNALALLQKASLYIGPEGGMHHGAAAVGIPAVVLFGGFIPPQVTGYDTHTNLTGNATEACGSLKRCDHCRQAMEAIDVDQVYEAAKGHLRRRAA